VGKLANVTIEGATIDFNPQTRLRHPADSVDPYFRRGEKVRLLAQLPAEAEFASFEMVQTAYSAPVQNKHWARVTVNRQFNVS
jgi:hypothetical protein